MSDGIADGLKHSCQVPSTVVANPWTCPTCLLNWEVALVLQQVIWARRGQTKRSDLVPVADGAGRKWSAA